MDSETVEVEESTCWGGGCVGGGGGVCVFFFNDTATTEIYTLSLHDALPIYLCTLPVWPDPLIRFWLFAWHINVTTKKLSPLTFPSDVMKYLNSCAIILFCASANKEVKY